MMTRALRAGVFLPPFHATDEDPTLCIERDFQLMEWLDTLGYDEAWIGEHHSGGFEIIGAPDLFIAAAAVRTRRIRLGTGVWSLPYHHPFIVADRMVQLDHQTRGRAMFGVGPGVLPSDALATGVPLDASRPRMEASLDAIVRLLAGEQLTLESDGFTMKDARLQLRPYTQPRPHLAVASSVTPTGGRLAGRYGLGLLSIAVSDRLGFDSLELNWRVANETAAAHGTTVDRSDWRLMAPFHIAETREKALANVAWGYEKFQNYRLAVSPTGSAILGIPSIEEIISEQRGAIGTPDDALAVLEKLWDKTGGFGCILLLAHDWADWEATKRSYELFARYVLPKFAERNRARNESMEYLRANGNTFSTAIRAGTKRAVDQYFTEEAARKNEVAP
jgi:limonene 1,2-monooxygenase